MQHTGTVEVAWTPSPWLRRYSKLVALLVLGLILKGALVTSHDAGLSVPDWPTSYGYNMFLFPVELWQGVIFYEHVHRLYASAVGLLTVILAVWLHLCEPRAWVRRVGYLAVLLVLLQGALGGLTVHLLLPTAVSSAHGILGQSFFVVMTLLAYTQSLEYNRRSAIERAPRVVRWGVVLSVLVFVQLVVGAVMRHAGAGLALPDFPKMGGQWLPNLSPQMMATANHLRIGLGLPPVDELQVLFHLLHRGGAVLVLVAICGLFIVSRGVALSTKVQRNITLLTLLTIVQIALGIATVLTVRQPWITSVHVVIGAALLGLSVLLVLRLSLPHASHGTSRSQAAIEPERIPAPAAS